MKIENRNFTFSELIKKEICNNKSLFLIEKEYLFLSILKNVGEFNNLNTCFELRTRYPFLIKFVKNFLSLDTLKSQITVLMSNKKTLGDKKTDYVLLIAPENVNKLIDHLAFSDFKTDEPIGQLIARDEQFLEKCSGFIMGAFLSGGSVNNPNTGNYHLELRTSSEVYKDLIFKVLNWLNLNPKLLVRRNNYVIYLKKSTEISDFLKLIKCNDSMFFLEEIRIERDFVNSMQRLVNLDVHNSYKSINVAKKQAEMCLVIKNSFRFNLLKPKEKLYCEIRIENPEATMIEICELMNKKLPSDKQISKGSLSHITKAISLLYEKIQNQ